MHSKWYMWLTTFKDCRRNGFAFVLLLFSRFIFHAKSSLITMHIQCFSNWILYVSWFYSINGISLLTNKQNEPFFCIFFFFSAFQKKIIVWHEYLVHTIEVSQMLDRWNCFTIFHNFFSLSMDSDFLRRFCFIEFHLSIGVNI